MPAHDAETISPDDLYGMVLHWFQTPAGAYFGSSYGNNSKSTLQRPMSDIDADEVLEKIMTDIPLLTVLPPGSVNVYAYPDPDFVDRSHIAIEVQGRLIEAPRS